MTGPRRATWVWTRPDPDELIAWSVEYGFGELFLGVGDTISIQDLSWYREVGDRAHAAGITVAALGGGETWLQRPKTAVGWVRSVIGTGLFDGIHVELEPWLRDDWLLRRNELVADYLAVLKAMARVCPTPLEADLAFWLHEVPAGPRTSLDLAVMRIVDAVTVLSYRNSATGPDSVSGVGARALAAAGRVGIPCRLAVETRDLGADPQSRTRTFHGLDDHVLGDELTTLDNLEANNATYNGVAFKTTMAGEVTRSRWRATR